MRVQSLACPNCGAPLPIQPAQTLAACVYCNSTVRILPAEAAAAPVAVRAVEVGPEVIDEVKRLLLLSQHQPAVEYYARAAGVDPAAAETAVKAIEKNMAYYPPLTLRGVALLFALDAVFLAGLLAGGWLLLQQQWIWGMVLILVCAFLALGNVLVLARGLRGFMISRRGEPAAAEIRQLWIISRHEARVPYELTRLLLEVQPAGRAPYLAEANGFILETSKPKFQVGRRVQVRFDPKDPRRVVLMGPEAS